MKKYGVSKRLKRIRDGFVSLNDAFKAAYETDNREELLRYNMEIAVYVRKYRQELRLSREFVEDMKTGALGMAKNIAEQIYEEEKQVRLRRELDEMNEKYFEAVKNDEAGGKLKWN